MLKETKYSVILVVDGDVQNRSNLKALLSSLGHPVVIAATGKEAMKIVPHTPPNLILLDVQLPDMDGFELCRQFRQQSETRLIPIVIITALDDKLSRIKGIAAGCDDFLIKPFDKLELIVRVGALLRLQYYRDQLNEKEKFELAIKHASEPMILVEKTGKVEDYNQAASHIFSIDRESISNRNIFDLFKTYFSMEPDISWDQMPHETFYFKLHRPESEFSHSLILSAKMFPLRDPEQQDAGYFIVFSDTTRRFREEKRKDQFIDLIAHKFRSACTIFMGSLSLLQQMQPEEKWPGDVTSLFNTLIIGAKRINQIFDRILEISDILSNKEMILKAPGVTGGELKKIIRDICSYLGKSPDHCLEFVNFNEAVSVPLEKKYVEKICFEVLQNTVKYVTHEMLKIEISLLVNPLGQKELTFLDNGHGIPQEEIERLGSRFVQIEKNFSGNLPGLGLGFFLIREIMEQVEGNLQIHSAPDKGLQVILVFPE